MNIIWDKDKNLENIKKHKVSLRIITARRATKKESKYYGGQ